MKNRHAVDWVVLGVLLWPLSVLAVSLPGGPQQEPSAVAPQVKDAPCFHEQTCITGTDGATWCKRNLQTGPGATTSSAGAASFRDCPDCPEMTHLPWGIAMGKYEVTQRQWRAVMGGAPSQFADCDNCPVEQVSWIEVHDYIERLNLLTGKNYRLPTEDEWYAACRSGGNFAYCGSNSINAVAWYEGNSDDRPHPVGQKQPNAFGLYDMSGNVWEWTSSCCGNGCSCRVYRGGSWDIEQSNMSAVVKEGLSTAVRYLELGFRLVRDY